MEPRVESRLLEIFRVVWLSSLKIGQETVSEVPTTQQHFRDFLSGVGMAGKKLHTSSSLFFVSGREEVAGGGLWPHAPRPSSTVANNITPHIYFEGKGIGVPGELEGKLGQCKHPRKQALELQ